MTRSISILGLGLCAALSCATKQLDTGTPHEAIPAVDPTPEFERDPVADDSHSTADVQTTIARINPEFAAMVRDAGITEELAREDALYTVFVPSPDVFKPELLKGDEAERRRLLSYFVVPGRMTSSELTNLQATPTITGQPIDILTNDAATFFAVNQARVLQPNIEATNGVVHEIDSMLLPPDHPAAPDLRDASPNGYVRIDVTLANACELSQPRAFFALDSDRVRPGAYDSLVDLARCLTTGPLAGQRLLIEGYADPRGTAQYNKSLARDRAESVERYLTVRGVQDEQVEIVSHGEKHAHDGLPAFWDFDRRVDISLAEDLKR